MNQTRNTKGIIYRMYNSGQADKVLHILDHDGKKVTILAKGVKKAGSRKAHSIDIGNYIEGKVIEGYNLLLLTEIKLLNEFRNWKDNYEKMIFLQFFCEIIDKFAYEENSDEMLFKVFYHILNADSQKTIYLASIFLLKILDITGHLPKLNECVISSTDIKADEVYYLADYVGYISKEAIENSGISAEKISDRIVKTQKYILDHNVDSALRIELSKEEELKMFIVELRWIENTIDAKLKSKDIILSLINKI